MLLRILLLNMIFSVLFCFADKSGKELDWKELGKGMELSKEEEKPLFVYIYSTHCGWCRRFNKATLQDTSVVRILSENFIVSRPNTSSTKKQGFKGKKATERQLAAMFAVRGVPSSVFLDSNGKLITKLPGFMPPDVFKKVLKYIGEKWYKDMSYQEFLESEKKLEKK